MIIVTGGKTGGHIYPLVAICKSLNYKFLYIGGKDFLESEVCKKNYISFIGLDLRGNIFKIIKEEKLLKEKIQDKPDAVISTGGFVSIPTVIYALKNRIPIILYEENVVFGYSNLIMRLFAASVFVAFPCFKKYTYVGLPVKRGITNKPHYDILIIGGSLGSRILADLAIKLQGKYNVLLIAGNYYKEYKNKVKNIISYTDDAYSYMKSSDIIIARAGASTAMEVFSLGKAFITIPSKKTKRNHQVKNAKYWSSLNACYLLDENNIDKIFEAIDEVRDKSNLEKMKLEQAKLYKRDSLEIIEEEIKNVI